MRSFAAIYSRAGDVAQRLLPPSLLLLVARLGPAFPKWRVV